MFDKKNFEAPLDMFISNALYHPKKGYYMKNIPFGKSGDYITAPNISKIFSEMIFLWIISYWEKFFKNKKINIIELGAGNGEMMHQIITSSKNFGNFYNNCHFKIYEKSEKLIKVQKKKLIGHKINWLKNLENLENKPTIFLGNEFLDALPIKQFFKYNNKWFEKFVRKEGGIYSFSKKNCDIKKIEKKLNFKISKNQKFLEISFDAINIIKKLNNIITSKGGCLLFIDYAYSKNQMFDTLQAIKNHKKISPLEDVGSADISYLINIPFLKKISKIINLKLDHNTQREFLLKMGILKRAEILSANKSFLEKANIFYRVERLINKKQMGELFKVMCFYKKNKRLKLGFK